MRLLHRYIGGSFIVAFLVTLFVLSSVVSMGAIFKMTDLIARGVSWRPIVVIFFYGMPAALGFVIPVSALTSSLLVFGRLSGDGEITAMKASGVSMWQVFAAPLAVAAALMSLCLWISAEVGPRSEYARRALVAELGAVSATDLLEEGRFIRDFEGYTIYIGREDEGAIQDIRIYDTTGDQRREIVAQSGRIDILEGTRDIALILRQVRIEPYYEDKPAFLDEYEVVLPDALSSGKPRVRLTDKTIFEVVGELAGVSSEYSNVSESDRQIIRTELLFEINLRLAVSLSCLAFVILGAPLGVKAHRKESSVGVAISLGLMLVFYIFVIVAESLAETPEAHPEVIVWLPVIISFLLGSWLVARTN
ncbi:MAG: LptF/LptG family permease [Verrucomicrobiota bacterium]